MCRLNYTKSDLPKWSNYCFKMHELIEKLELNKIHIIIRKFELTIKVLNKKKLELTIYADLTGKC